MQKVKPFRSQKLRESARGMSCTLRLPGCLNNPETVVLCHSPFLEHGKGKGRKADDHYACYGCAWCHDILDGRIQAGFSKDELRQYFYAAMAETREQWSLMNLHYPKEGEWT